MIPLLLALVAAEPAAPPDYLPCVAGLVVRYRRTPVSGPVRAFEERVLGPGKEPRSCVLERVTPGPPGPPSKAEPGAAAASTKTERFVRELLPDRVLSAGWVETPLAFRPILLKAPLEVGKTWRFTTTDYAIVAVGERVRVPAGEFGETVVVRERSLDGKHEGEATYARGLGLLRWRDAGGVTEAVEVVRP